MDLYLIRHADALALGERGNTQDSERPLSEKGYAQAKLLGAWMQRKGIALNQVFTSPLLRAHQTAEGMVGSMSPAPPLQPCPELAPGEKPKRLRKVLKRWGGERAALIGHLPDLPEFAAWLIGSKRAQIDLAKAGIAYIQVPEEPYKGGGVLVWLVTPEWLKGEGS
jgi:phosphohistidine phosphatase